MKQKLWFVSGLFFLALSCFAEESALNKRISVDYRNMQLGEVLTDLEKKSGVKISVASDLLLNQDSVTYLANEQEAGRVLTRILKQRGLKLEKPEGN